MSKSLGNVSFRYSTSFLLATSLVTAAVGFAAAPPAIAAGATSLPILEINLDSFTLDRFNRLTGNPAQPIAQRQQSLPSAIASTLRQDLSQITGIPAKKFQIVEAVPKDWPNGCLGLAKPGEMCTQAIVPGWRVTLSNRTRRWVYRTNAQGSLYRLEPTSQQSRPNNPRPAKPLTSKLKPEIIPTSELPPDLQDGVVFRAIATGGFAGRITQTTLLQDGRMIQSSLNANGTPTETITHQLSTSQVQAFQAVLTEHSLEPFHRQDYPVTAGAADFVTMTISSQRATVRYVDFLQEQLPVDMKAVVQAWNELTRSV